MGVVIDCLVIDVVTVAARGAVEVEAAVIALSVMLVVVKVSSSAIAVEVSQAAICSAGKHRPDITCNR